MYHPEKQSGEAPSEQSCPNNENETQHVTEGRSSWVTGMSDLIFREVPILSRTKQTIDDVNNALREYVQPKVGSKLVDEERGNSNETEESDSSTSSTDNELKYEDFLLLLQKDSATLRFRKTLQHNIEHRWYDSISLGDDLAIRESYLRFVEDLTDSLLSEFVNHAIAHNAAKKVNRDDSKSLWSQTTSLTSQFIAQIGMGDVLMMDAPTIGLHRTLLSNYIARYLHSCSQDNILPDMGLQFHETYCKLMDAEDLIRPEEMVESLPNGLNILPWLQSVEKKTLESRGNKADDLFTVLSTDIVNHCCEFLTATIPFDALIHWINIINVSEAIYDVFGTDECLEFDGLSKIICLGLYLGSKNVPCSFAQFYSVHRMMKRYNLPSWLEDMSLPKVNTKGMTCFDIIDQFVTELDKLVATATTKEHSERTTTKNNAFDNSKGLHLVHDWSSEEELSDLVISHKPHQDCQYREDKPRSELLPTNGVIIEPKSASPSSQMPSNFQTSGVPLMNSVPLYPSTPPTESDGTKK